MHENMRKIFKLSLILSLLPLAMYSMNGNDVIIPRPTSVKMHQGEYVIPEVVTLYAPKNQVEAIYFIDELKDLCSTRAEITFNDRNAHLILSVDSETIPDPEGYRLIIREKGIKIVGNNNAGVFYGLQSLLQLFNATKEKGTIKAQQIDDAPAYPWRAYMIDESRYFKGEKEVYRALDEMAALKLNTLHWHLTDDAGWRIEIKKYPKLTDIGSKRKDTQVGGYSSDETMGEPHEGFYTQEDVKRILRYAKQRHIRVIPEIEMPGHASAAIAAYPWLGSKEEEVEVPVRFGKHYPTFNVANEKVQRFLKDVVDEVLVLFDGEIIHIGGDEVRFNHWEENDEINKLMREEKFSSYMDVQIYFSNMMSQYIQNQGARMMGWNEILGLNLHEDDNISFDKPSQKIAENVIVHFWKGDPKEITRAVENGYDIVNSQHEYTYLIYDYKSLPLEMAYSFDPIPPGLPDKYKHKILGIGCQMWSEWTPTPESIEKQTYPRIAAYAEVGWTAREEKDYNSFLSRLNYYIERWARKEIDYQPLTEM